MGLDLYTYEDNSILRTVVHWIVDIACVVSFAWFIVFGYLNQTIINGHSMSPTLEAEDMCLVNRLAYDVGDPKRYDIVVFEREDTKQTNVKRVIGLPGETVQIIDGYVYINGELLESDIYGAEPMESGQLADQPITLGADEYFVLGDNRNHSSDSRDPSVGVLKRSDLLGRAWVRIYPFDKAGFIRHE